MLFPISGRCGFESLKYNEEDKNKFDFEILKKMLQRENEIRLSDEIQMQYEEMDMMDDEKYVEITDQVQKKVLNEFGFEGNEKERECYRTALEMYPQQKEELKQLVFYYKYNRSRDGELKVGDTVPLSSVVVTCLAGHTEYPLSSFFTPTDGSTALPVVICAGSIT